MKKFPNAFVIVLGVVLTSWICTFIIPQGAYQRVFDNATERNSVVPNSFEQIQAPSLTVFDLLLSIPKGITGRADVIVLILLLGGCFYVIEKTGALNQGLSQLISLLNGKESLSLIVLCILFLAGGFTVGLQEEIIAMTPVLLLFGKNLGYNSATIIYSSYGSATLGSAFSPFNPFGVIIAQKEAELELLSGIEFRLIVLLIVSIVWVLYILRYAKRNRIEKENEIVKTENLSLRNKIILSLLVLTFAVVSYGLIYLDWGFMEMSASFFGLGIASGLIARFGINKTTEVYVDGFKEMIFASIIIGLANSISVVLKEGSIIDSIVYGLFTPLQHASPSLAAVVMMTSQSVLHFPIPSYSGQAILTMPILTPLSDLIGMSRQVCVLAYQYGAIMMDVIVPTNGALMAVIAIGGIRYNSWIKFIIKPALIIFAIAVLAILVAVQIGYS